MKLILLLTMSPKREDETINNDGSDLRYCWKHKQYYSDDIGCQQCWIETQKNNDRNNPIDLNVCPVCLAKSLFFNKTTTLYECLNPRCRRAYSQETLVHERNQMLLAPSDAVNQSNQNSDYPGSQHTVKETDAITPIKNPCPVCRNEMVYTSGLNSYWCGVCQKYYETPQQPVKSKTPKQKISIDNWLKALLFVFAFFIAGMGISIAVNDKIPLWIFSGFSISFSVDKWLSYVFNKHRFFGGCYRLFLNLYLLATLAILIYQGVTLFTYKSGENPAIGSIVLIIGIVFFVWLCRIVSKHSWRRPSMKLTTFSLVVILLIFAFAGVRPLSTYKDTAWDKITTAFSGINNNSLQVASSNALTTTPSQAAAQTNLTTPSSQITTSSTSSQAFNFRTGVYNNFFLGLVHDPAGVLSGDGCYDDKGEFIVLINNINAVDPTYAQLVTFLRNNKTDQYPYTYTNRLYGTYYGTAESHVDLTRIKSIIDGTVLPGDPCVCSDFAERLHNDAEMAGIRCAYVSIDLSGYTAGHALVAFQTADQGLIYVDDTNAPGPDRCVKTVALQQGKEYIPVSLFPEPGWLSTWDSMGTVTSIYTTWDGNWNN